MTSFFVWYWFDKRSKEFPTEEKARNFACKLWGDWTLVEHIPGRFPDRIIERFERGST